MEISSSREAGVGGTCGLEHLLNFEIPLGGRQTCPPDPSGMLKLLWEEAERKI